MSSCFYTRHYNVELTKFFIDLSIWKETRMYPWKPQTFRMSFSFQNHGAPDFNTLQAIYVSGCGLYKLHGKGSSILLWTLYLLGKGSSIVLWSTNRQLKKRFIISIVPLLIIFNCYFCYLYMCERIWEKGPYCAIYFFELLLLRWSLYYQLCDELCVWSWPGLTRKIWALIFS